MLDTEVTKLSMSIAKNKSGPVAVVWVSRDLTIVERPNAGMGLRHIGWHGDDDEKRFRQRQ